jgi:Phage integrase family
MRGVPPKAVQELLGHESMEMTMRFAHVAPEVRSHAVDVLDEPPKKWAVKTTAPARRGSK